MWPDHFRQPVVLSPYAARFPFETWIIPKAHMSCFEGITDAQINSFSRIGNVRELKNIVERLIIMSLGNHIGIDDLPDDLSAKRRSVTPEYQGLPLREARDLFEADHIRRVLHACDGNISRAADHLGVERSNLSKKIRQLGIAPNSA